MEALKNDIPQSQVYQGMGKPYVAPGGQESQTTNSAITGGEINSSPYDIARIMGGLYGDGFIALKGAFSREWAQRLDEDIAVLYPQALARPGGAVGRGR